LEVCQLLTQVPRDRASTSVGGTNWSPNDTPGIWSLIPEPSTALLMGLGLGGLAAIRRK